MAVKISQLVFELIARIETLPNFTDKGFSIYSLEDLEGIKAITYPIVGVGYEGTGVVPGNTPPFAKGCGAVNILTLRFSVLIAMEYEGADGTLDSKEVATDLLDSVRSSLLGYRNINNRPWRFVSESPVPGNIDGVIFYGQLWETDKQEIGALT